MQLWKTTAAIFSLAHSSPHTFLWLAKHPTEITKCKQMCPNSCHKTNAIECSWCLKAFPVGVDWFPEGGRLLLSCPLLKPMVERRVESSDVWQTARDYSLSIPPISNESVRECHDVPWSNWSPCHPYRPQTLCWYKKIFCLLH